MRPCLESWTIGGERISLAQHADKVKLIVNVASRCGLTQQYGELATTADVEGMAGTAKWNFETFAVTPAGEVRRFRCKVEPDAAEIVELIEACLPQPADLS